MNKREVLMAKIAKAKGKIARAEDQCRVAEDKYVEAENLVDETSDALGEACLVLTALEKELDDLDILEIETCDSRL